VAKDTTAALRQAIRSAEALVEPSGVSDQELLRRFAEGSDQAAFAALVRRHGGMVLGVCRRALGNAADAEDACQATFLVLLRKAAGRWQPSVANYLYTTARQVAANARRVAQRRSRREGRAAVPEAVEPIDQMTGRELLAALDEELGRLPPRYREPLVLCYLEGLTRDEAAARVGVPVNTVKTQLERGRKKLAEALTKRGCGLGVGLLAVVAASQARAASPRLVDAVAAAMSGTPPAAVAALARGVSMNTLANRSLGLMLAMLAFTWLGLGVWSARQSVAGPPAARGQSAQAENAKAKPPAQDEGRALTGQVVGPDGKPVEGARVVLAATDPQESKSTREVARTDAAGRFRCVLPGQKGDNQLLLARAAGFAADWVQVRNVDPAQPVVLRLAKATLPVRGRVLTLEGKSVPGAVVRVLRVQAPDGKNGLKELFAKWAASPYQAVDLLQKQLHHPAAAGLPEKVTTDSAGRFEIRGVGDGRVLVLEIAAETIETVVARVALSAERPSSRGGPPLSGPPFYAATFDHAAAPCRVIQGTVFDQKTKKPVADVVVSGRVRRGWWEVFVYARTDAAGRYRLAGLRNTECELMFGTSKPSAYLSLAKTVGPSLGLTPVTLDMPMVRGTVVTGRVTDRTTGMPVLGGVGYAPLSGNKHLDDLPGRDVHVLGNMSYHIDADGRFRLVVPPGIGILTMQNSWWASDVKPYPRVRLRAEDRGKPFFRTRADIGDMFITAANAYYPLSTTHAYRVIDPPAGTEKLTVDIQLDAGKTVAVKVVGPDGQPFKGATVTGRVAMFDEPAILKDDTFTVAALLPEDSRLVAAVHADKKLGGTVVVDSKEKAPPVVRLAAWGTLTGRVVGSDGQPVAGMGIGLAFGFPGVKFSARPTPPPSAAAKLYGHLMGDREVTTGADGRFRCDVPFAGLAFNVSFVHKGKRLGAEKPPRDVTVAPGKTRDLGDIVVKGE
jgi:RNA polymerase sigma factor (sigma-70 family)